MAMADDEVTDEVLVEELEKLRKGPGKDRRFHPSLAWQSRHIDSVRIGHIGHSRANPVPHMSDAAVAHTSDPTTDSEDAATWRTARSAVLCCREMVRTERRYHGDLNALLDGKVCLLPRLPQLQTLMLH